MEDEDRTFDSSLLLLGLSLIVVNKVRAAVLHALRKVLGSCAERTPFMWDDSMLDTVLTPLTWIMQCVAFIVVINWSDFGEDDEKEPVVSKHMIMSALWTFLVVCVLWLCNRLYQFGRNALLSSTKRHKALQEQASHRRRRHEPSHLEESEVANAEEGDSMSKNDFSDVLQTLMGTSGVIIIFLMVIHHMGVETTTLVTGFGIGGIVLGFAVKDVLKNLVGTWIIFSDRLWKSGDEVSLTLPSGNGLEGIVEKVTLRSTIMTGHDGRRYRIPNAVVADRPVGKKYHRSAMRRDMILILAADDKNTVEKFIRWRESVLAYMKDLQELDHERCVIFLEKTDMVNMYVRVVLVGNTPEPMDSIDKEGNLIHDDRWFYALRQTGFLSDSEKATLKFAQECHNLNMKCGVIPERG